MFYFSLRRTGADPTGNAYPNAPVPVVYPRVLPAAPQSLPCGSLRAGVLPEVSGKAHPQGLRLLVAHRTGAGKSGQPDRSVTKMRESKTAGFGALLVPFPAGEKEPQGPGRGEPRRLIRNKLLSAQRAGYAMVL